MSIASWLSSLIAVLVLLDFGIVYCHYCRLAITVCDDFSSFSSRLSQYFCGCTYRKVSPGRRLSWFLDGRTPHVKGCCYLNCKLLLQLVRSFWSHLCKIVWCWYRSRFPHTLSVEEFLWQISMTAQDTIEVLKVLFPKKALINGKSSVLPVEHFQISTFNNTNFTILTKFFFNDQLILWVAKDEKKALIKGKSSE